MRGDGVAPAVANLSSAQLFAAVGGLFGVGLLGYASLLAPSLWWFAAVASATGLGLLCALRLAISAGAGGHPRLETDEGEAA